MWGIAELYSFGLVMGMLKEEGRGVWWKRIMAYQAGLAFLERDLGKKNIEKGRNLPVRIMAPSSSGYKRFPCLPLGS